MGFWGQTIGGGGTDEKTAHGRGDDWKNINLLIS